MTDRADSTPQAAVDSTLDRALLSYAGFLGHQLAEIAILMAGAPADAHLAAARSRLDLMLEDLRDLSAAARVRAPVDLAEIARDTARDLTEPGSRVDLGTQADLPLVCGDPDLLRSLLAHLMRVALAASRSGVAFTLRAAPGEPGRIHFELEERGEAGSSTDAARRLIPFERPRASGRLAGAGVSGPAAARLVAAHGGDLELCTDGDAVLVSFDLPAADA